MLHSDPSHNPRKPLSGYLKRVPQKVDYIDQEGYFLDKDTREIAREKHQAFQREYNKALQALAEAEKNRDMSAKTAAQQQLNAIRPYEDFSIHPSFPVIRLRFTDQRCFVIGAKLASGTFGTVYAVQDIDTGRWHCAKIFKNSPGENELEIASQEGLYRKDDASPMHLIMELIHGEDLSYFLKKNKPLSFEQSLELSINILEAYNSLHQKGYVHGDIKPANIIVDTDTLICYAIDFGFSQKIGLKLGIQGTFFYMTPEIFYDKEHITTQSDDIYAMAMCIAEILILSEGENRKTEAIIEQLDQQFDPLTLLDHTIRKDPSKRSEKAREVLLRNQEKLVDVLAGAIHYDYQKELRFSDAKIELYQFIYEIIFDRNEREKITGQEIYKSQHPELKIKFYALQGKINKLKEFRLKHIRSNIPLLDLEKEALAERLLQRAEQFSQKDSIETPHAANEIYVFLLRMVDSREENKPTKEEMKAFEAKIIDIDQKRQAVITQLKELPVKTLLFEEPTINLHERSPQKTLEKQSAPMITAMSPARKNKKRKIYPCPNDAPGPGSKRQNR